MKGSRWLDGVSHALWLCVYSGVAGCRPGCAANGGLCARPVPVPVLCVCFGVRDAAVPLPLRGAVTTLGMNGSDIPRSDIARFFFIIWMFVGLFTFA